MFKQLAESARQWVAAAVVASGAIACGSANAAIYTGVWDPLYNPLFSAAVGQSVGWRGGVSLTVDNACVATGGSPTVGNAACPSASLDGANLTFYNTISNATIGGIFFAGTLPPVTQLGFSPSGELTGFDLAGPLTATLFIFSPKIYDMELDFTLAGPSLKLTDNFGECFNCGSPAVYNNVTTPTITFARVPEPASLALVGLALSALVFSRRRRG